MIMDPHTEALSRANRDSKMVQEPRGWIVQLRDEETGLMYDATNHMPYDQAHNWLRHWVRRTVAAILAEGAAA